MGKLIFPKKILTVILVVIVAAAVVYFLFFKTGVESTKAESGQKTADEARKPADSPISVKVTQANRGDLVITLKSPGEAVTDRIITIKAEVSGIVKSLNVRESQRVTGGDLLCELDDREYRLDMESAEADRLKNLSDLLLEKQLSGQEEVAPQESDKMLKAREDYERSRQQFREGKISEAEFEEAYRQLEPALIASGEKKDEVMAAAKGLTQSEIRVKKARMNLGKCRIRAPFAGIIHDLKISPSEHVAATRELFTLVNIDRIQVHAKVLESEVAKIRVGREAEMKFSAYPDRVFKGRVHAVSPVIDPKDRTCKVIVGVANPESEIKPGMHAEVEIVTDIHEERLLIPQEAILVREGRKLAFVVEEGLAKWRYIQVGLENEDYAEILPSERPGEGIKEGEVVIIDGHFTLAHDARVRIDKDSP